MDLILQKELPHQQRAVDAACSVLQGCGDKEACAIL